MSTMIVSPMKGRLASLAEVPDPVFATGMAGDGVAIFPDIQSPIVEVYAPVSGQLTWVMPHAFVITTQEGLPILVHVGIDTVKLKGQGFEVHKEKKSMVEAGEKIITVDAHAVQAAGFSLACPVVLMEHNTHQDHDEAEESKKRNPRMAMLALLGDDIEVGRELVEFSSRGD